MAEKPSGTATPPATLPNATRSSRSSTITADSPHMTNSLPHSGRNTGGNMGSGNWSMGEVRPRAGDQAPHIASEDMVSFHQPCRCNPGQQVDERCAPFGEVDSRGGLP